LQWQSRSCPVCNQFLPVSHRFKPTISHFSQSRRLDGRNVLKRVHTGTIEEKRAQTGLPLTVESDVYPTREEATCI
jgi:hypothetical protein